jgi:hypothetical protein
MQSEENFIKKTLKKLCVLCVTDFASFAFPLLLPLLFLFLFLSCTTAPKIADPLLDESAFLPLEPGASVYLLADVPVCRPILDRLEIREIDKDRYQELLNRTRSVAAALYPEGSARRFQAAAWGNYPKFRGSLALAAGRAWKKNHSETGGPYWYSVRDGLSIALSPTRAFVSGAGPGNKSEPFTRPPGTGTPEGFAEFRQGAALVLWLDDPAGPVNRFLDALALPLQVPAEMMLVSLFPAGTADSGDQEEAGGRNAGTPPDDSKTGGAAYEALVRIVTPGANQARALLTLINMAKIFTGDAADTGDMGALAALLLANPPVLDGRNLTIKTAPLDAERIALLFRAFSLYS